MNWKQQQAQQTTASHGEMEQQFSDLVVTSLNRNLKQFMEKDGCYYGFEIVHNDEDYQRLVGVSIFKIQDDFCLIPQIFQNGQVVSSCDMIYISQKKTFVPQTSKWQESILKDQSLKIGDSVGKSWVNRQVNTIDLFKIRGTKMQGKLNFQDGIQLECAINGMVGNVVTNAEIPDALDGCDIRIKKQFAEQIKKSTKFQAYQFSTGLDSRIINEVEAASAEEEKQQKQQSEKTIDLVFTKDQSLESLNKEQLGYYMRDGWTLLDTRTPEKTSKVQYEVEHHIVNSYGADTTESVTKGQYEVILQDGAKSYQTFFGVKWTPQDRARYQNGHGTPVFKDFNTNSQQFKDDNYDPQSPKQNRVDVQKVVIGVSAKGELIRGEAGNVFGRKLDIGSEKEDQEVEALDFDSVKKGGSYLLALDGGLDILPVAIKVIDIDKRSDGICILEIEQKDLVLDGDSYPLIKDVRFNPDSNTRPWNGLLGGDVKFVKIKSFEKKDIVHAAGLDDLNTMHSKDSLNYVGKLKFDDEWKFEFGGKKKASVSFNSIKAQNMYLSFVHGIHQLTQRKIIDAQEKSGSVIFQVKAQASLFPTEFLGDPVWEKSIDSVTNQELDFPQQFSIPSTRGQLVPPESTLGDGWDPHTGQSLLISKTPEELQKFSEENKVQKLFDHQQIGELQKVYSGDSIFEQVTPKLYKAVDALARFTFLLMWKPEDFQKQYGDVDVKDKTESFKQTFKQLGELLLDIETRQNIEKRKSSPVISEEDK